MACHLPIWTLPSSTGQLSVWGKCKNVLPPEKDKECMYGMWWLYDDGRADAVCNKYIWIKIYCQKNIWLHYIFFSELVKGMCRYSVAVYYITVHWLVSVPIGLSNNIVNYLTPDPTWHLSISHWVLTWGRWPVNTEEAVGCSQWRQLGQRESEGRRRRGGSVQFSLLLSSFVVR